MFLYSNQLKLECNEMSKVYNQQVEVQINKNLPVAFLWRGMWRFVVDIQKILIFRDCLNPNYCLDTYRISDRSGGVFDFVIDNGKWILERVWDHKIKSRDAC